MSRKFIGATKIDNYGRVSVLRESITKLGISTGEVLMVYLDTREGEVIIKRAEKK